MGYLLVLGAGTDIAQAIAMKYASSGYNIYLADKNTEQLEETRIRINEEFETDAQALKFDVTEFYNHRNFYNSLSPKPAGVICAIDYQGDGFRAQKDFLEAKRIVDINYTGLMAMLNIIANDYEENKSGFITVLGYAEDKKDEKAHYIYKSAKNALNTYVSGLKGRLAKSNINVMTANLCSVRFDPERFAEDIFNEQQKGKDSWNWAKKILWK
jgi:decaprenylphospho-beta-D-erythro-pentofuranosid-2-ulose 2-reductase